MRVFTTFARGEVTQSAIPISGLLYVLVDAASRKYGKDWETVAREFREKSGTPVGSGYKKEIE